MTGHGTLSRYWDEVQDGLPCGPCAVAFVEDELTRRQIARTGDKFRFDGTWRLVHGVWRGVHNEPARRAS